MSRPVKMKVAVGLSGGVDSSVAAALLKEKGYEVVGLFMKLWEGDGNPAGGEHGGCSAGGADDLVIARSIAEQLAIPFYVVDLAGEYRAAVLDYCKREYLAGRTPNPCIRCNQQVKFGSLITRARQSGIDFDLFATGHYARVDHHEGEKRSFLKKGRDVRKDQSYWLAFLEQQQLAMTLFPLGEEVKTEVRAKAKSLGLSTCDKPDSQDFFAGDYKKLIDVSPRPGPIVDQSGSVLGSHNGIWSYTIGQRKGLGIAAKEPLYVIDVDAANNAVVVGFAPELNHGGLVASGLNLIACDFIDGPREVEVKIRYTQKAFPGVMTQLDHETAAVRFTQPQSSITPGQAAVFYDGDCVLGGAIIERAVD